MSNTASGLLYAGHGIVAVDKPPGVVTIPARSGDPGASMRARLESVLGQKVWVVHRLDRDTSGVLVFATDADAHRRLCAAFEAGRVEKRYLALVEGRVPHDLDLDDPLEPGRRGRTRVARSPGGGKPSRTLVRVLEQLPGCSLVEARPLTGRQHQIRVHLAAAGFPLLVDRQYGRRERWPDEPRSEETVALDRTPLHCSGIRFPPADGVGEIVVEAPLAADFARLLEVLRRGGEALGKGGD